MPPRGRPRKAGPKRMDAAVENMRLLGFSGELVRTTVKRLLEVYDGDAGWLFIEEGSYKLLIDTILDEQDTGLLKGSASEGNARNGNTYSAVIPSSGVEDARDGNTSSAGIPSSVVEDATSETNETGGEAHNPPAEEEGTSKSDINLQRNPFHSPPAGGDACNRAAGEERTEKREDLSLKQNPSESSPAGGEAFNPPAEEERTQKIEDISLEKNPFHSPAGVKACNPPAQEERTEKRDINLKQNPFRSPPCAINPSAPVEGVVKQRRKRFYGWISDNELDHTADFIQLIPATNLQLEKLRSGTDTHSMSRWDEKPE